MAFWNKSSNEQPEDFSVEDLHTIIENGIKIINGTSETAGPEWSPVAVPIIRGALRELQEKEAMSKK